MRFIMLAAVLVILHTAMPAANAESAGAEVRGMKNQASADFFRNTAQRDKQVNNGFGIQPVRPPSSTAGPPAPRQPMRNPSVPIAAPAPPRRQSASFGVGTAGATSKPFSSVNTQPTISPYLGLFDGGLGDYNDLNYQTIVRPQIQQQQFNQQVVREAQSLNRRMSAISARNPYNTQGNEGVMPTGHAATFQYYSRFYPRQSQRRR